MRRPALLRGVRVGPGITTHICHLDLLRVQSGVAGPVGQAPVLVGRAHVLSEVVMHLLPLFPAGEGALAWHPHTPRHTQSMNSPSCHSRELGYLCPGLPWHLLLLLFLGSGCLHSLPALNGQLIQGDLLGTHSTVHTPNLLPEGDENRKDRTNLEGKSLFSLDCHFRTSIVSIYT